MARSGEDCTARSRGGGWSEPAEGPGSWAERARCASNVPPSIAFTDVTTRAVAEAAMAFCATCDVQAQCLEYAQKWKLDGVWGGQLLQDGQTRLRRMRAPSTRRFAVD